MEDLQAITIETNISQSMHRCISNYLDSHPDWSLDRVINASLSLFLIQNYDEMNHDGHQICTQTYLNYMVYYPLESVPQRN